MRSTKFIGLILCAFFGLVSAVWAYTPPSGFIVKSWVAKRGRSSKLRIQSWVTAVENDQLTTIKFKDTTWYDPATQTVKSLATTLKGRKLHTVEKTLSSSPLVTKLLIGTDSQALSRALRDQNVPIRAEEELSKFRTEAERRKAEEVSLTRVNGRVGWAIGSRLIIEKDTFAPLRLIATNADGKEDDFRFDGMRYYKEFSFPKIQNLYRKGVWVLSSQVIDIGPETGKPDSAVVSDDSVTSALESLVRQYYESFR